jgi:hypothetical protein
MGKGEGREDADALIVVIIIVPVVGDWCGGVGEGKGIMA